PQARRTASVAPERRHGGTTEAWLRDIRVLMEERLERALLLAVDGEQLETQVGVEAVSLDLGPAVRDGRVQDQELLAIVDEEGRARLGEARGGDPAQVVDRAHVRRLGLLDLGERPLGEQALSLVDRGRGDRRGRR